MLRDTDNPKRIQLVAVVALVLCAIALCSTRAMADEPTGSVTVSCDDAYASKDGHTYTAYRLFSGEVHDDSTLSDATTDGCMSASFYDQAGLTGPASEMVVQLASKVSDDSEGAYVAELSRVAVATSKSRAIATFGVNQAQSLPEGWYLMVSDAAQPFAVLVGGKPVTVTEKSVPPSLSKGIVGADGRTTDSALANSWSNLTFELDLSLPSNFAAYDAFPCSVVDTPSSGLTVDKGSVHVSVRHADGSADDVSSGFETTLSDDTLRVSFDDLRRVDGISATDTVVVTYTALVNPKATAGFSDGNPNEAFLEYRRSPSFDGTGKTPPVTARAYTLALRVTKRDATTRRTLTGAAFAIGRDGKWLGTDGLWHDDVQELSCDGTGRLSVTGIAPGTYTLRETKAPSGYSLADDSTVVVDADLAGRTLDVTAMGSAEVTATDAGTGTADVAVDDVPSGSDLDRSRRSSNPTGTTPRGTSQPGAATGAANPQSLFHTGGGIAALAAIAAGSALTIAGVAWRCHERRDDDHVS